MTPQEQRQHDRQLARLEQDIPQLVELRHLAKKIREDVKNIVPTYVRTYTVFDGNTDPIDHMLDRLYDNLDAVQDLIFPDNKGD